MDLVAQAKQIDKSQLCPYVRQLLEGLIPILAKLDPAKVSETSCLVVIQDKHRSLDLRIEPADDFGQGMYIVADEGEFELGLAGATMMECHRNVAESMKDSVDKVLCLCSKYLAGITLIDEYGARGNWIRQKWYWGIDTEGDERQKIGTHSGLLSGLFSSVHTSSKRTYRFLK